MSSSITVCNTALLSLGDEPINDFDEDSDRALLCKNLYPSIRDWMLRRSNWNFAIRRVVLSPDSDAPAFDYGYKFTLPNDWMRTIAVGAIGEKPEYEVNERTILMNQNTLKLKYVFRNDNEITWDPSFIHLMEVAMKATLSYPITRSTSKEQLCMAEFKDILSDTKAIDGQENPPEELGDFPLINARYR